MYQLTGNVNIINAEQIRRKKKGLKKNKPKTERHVIQSFWWLPSSNSTFSEFICKVQPYKLAQQRKHNRIIADWLYVPHDSCVIALHLSHTVNQTAPNRVDLFSRGSVLVCKTLIWICSWQKTLFFYYKQMQKRCFRRHFETFHFQTKTLPYKN